jgi:hypothetical protein
MEEQTTILPLEPVELPLLALRAALTCASTEETRFYLNGIHVHQVNDEYRIVGCDGHRLFVFSTPVEVERRGATVPAWIKAGVTISADGLKDRLSLLDKLDVTTARIAYQVDSPRIVISDPGQSCQFVVQPAGGEFADYQRVLETVKAFEEREVTELTSIGFNAGYLKDAAALAKMLGSSSARVFGGSSTGTGDPSVILFPECPFAVLVLMPIAVPTQRLGVGASKVLVAAVNGTVAALRAHRTRLVNKLDGAKGNGKKAIENKIADYDKRIAAVLLAADTTPALPPPDPLAGWPAFQEAVISMLREKTGVDDLTIIDGHRNWLFTAFQAGRAAEEVMLELAENEEYPWRTHRPIGEVDAEGFATFRESLAAELESRGIDIDELAPEQGVLERLFQNGHDPEFAGSALLGTRSQLEAALAEPAPQSYAIIGAVEAEVRPAEQDERAAYRRGLKAAGRRKAHAKFYADVNATLSAENGGLTIDGLADGVPVDDWFDAGLDATEAATRCLDWRRIGTVLPPDEVGPGEADLPVGLLKSGVRPQLAAPLPEAEVVIAAEAAGEAEAAAEAAPDSTEAEARIEAVPEETRDPAEIVAAALPEHEAQTKGNGKTRKPRGAYGDFDSFRKQVDAIVQDRMGLSLDDLVDVPLRDWFDNRVSAKSAADKAIRAQRDS